MKTPLTPENAALVLIDHQDGTMKLIKTNDVDDARQYTLALAKAAKILKMPVRPDIELRRPGARPDHLRLGGACAGSIRVQNQAHRHRERLG
jgi:hypothetical protein